MRYLRCFCFVLGLLVATVRTGNATTIYVGKPTLFAGDITAPNSTTSAVACRNYVLSAWNKTFGFYPVIASGGWVYWGVEPYIYSCSGTSCIQSETVNSTANPMYDAGVLMQLTTTYTARKTTSNSDGTTTTTPASCSWNLQLQCAPGFYSNLLYRSKTNMVIPSIITRDISPADYFSYYSSYSNTSIYWTKYFNANSERMNYARGMFARKGFGGFTWRTWYDPLWNMSPFTVNSRYYNFEEYYGRYYPYELTKIDYKGRRYYMINPLVDSYSTRDFDEPVSWDGYMRGFNIGPYPVEGNIIWFEFENKANVRDAHSSCWAAYEEGRVPHNCGGEFNAFLMYLEHNYNNEKYGWESNMQLLSGVWHALMSCVACRPGQYSSLLGAVTSGDGVTACKTCPDGTYSKDYGSTLCYSCAAGNYKNADGTGCESCSNYVKEKNNSFDKLLAYVTSAAKSSTAQQCYLPGGREVEFDDEFGSGVAVLSENCYTE